jgi:hypothetical protein
LDTNGLCLGWQRPSSPLAAGLRESGGAVQSSPVGAISSTSIGHRPLAHVEVSPGRRLSIEASRVREPKAQGMQPVDNRQGAQDRPRRCRLLGHALKSHLQTEGT